MLHVCVLGVYKVWRNVREEREMGLTGSGSSAARVLAAGTGGDPPRASCTHNPHKVGGSLKLILFFSNTLNL